MKKSKTGYNAQKSLRIAALLRESQEELDAIRIKSGLPLLSEEENRALLAGIVTVVTVTAKPSDKPGKK